MQTDVLSHSPKKKSFEILCCHVKKKQQKTGIRPWKAARIKHGRHTDSVIWARICSKKRKKTFKQAGLTGDMFPGEKNVPNVCDYKVKKGCNKSAAAMVTTCGEGMLWLTSGEAPPLSPSLSRKMLPGKLQNRKRAVFQKPTAGYLQWKAARCSLVDGGEPTSPSPRNIVTRCKTSSGKSFFFSRENPKTDRELNRTTQPTHWRCGSTSNHESGK